MESGTSTFDIFPFDIFLFGLLPLFRFCPYVQTFITLFSIFFAYFNMNITPIITFSQSNKGTRVIICDGFVYHLNKSCPKVKYWRCENCLCSAVLHTDANDQFKALKGDHSSHLSSPAHIEILNFNANVKERVTTEATPIPRIYDEELTKAQLSQTALCIAPLAQDASRCTFFVTHAIIS